MNWTFVAKFTALVFGSAVIGLGLAFAAFSLFPEFFEIPLQ